MDKSKLTESANLDDKEYVNIITETSEYKAHILYEKDSYSLYKDQDRKNHYFIVY
jgi:hypothetical protein